MLSRGGNAFALANARHSSQPKAKHLSVLDADNGKTTLGRRLPHSITSSMSPLTNIRIISSLDINRFFYYFGRRCS